MSYIHKPDYTKERERPRLLSNYMEQMKRFIKARNPRFSEETIEKTLKDIILERFISPTVEAVIHKREGCSEHVTMPLDKYIKEQVADHNLSPSGSCFMRVSRKESFVRITIDQKVKDRTAFKKKYLDYEARGMKRESQYYNQNQANAKIFNNAIAGGMRIKQFILGSLAGFNAITSVGRICVKQGYSFIERAVNGNLYLPRTRDAITYIFNHARHVPEDFAVLIHDNTLYVPTTEQVTAYIVDSLQKYVTHPQVDLITEMVESLTPVERSYVFYAGCLNNLFKYNDKPSRAWIDSCFVGYDVDPSLYRDIDPAEVKTFRDDVVSCVLSTNYKMLGQNPERPGKWNSIKDALKFNPEGVKAFTYACRIFVKNFEEMLFILRPILRIETTFSKLIFQNRMARETVPLSDTDSNIFSTQELVRWKQGRIDFTQKSYEMNALTTFILSQSLEHVFGKLAAGLGVEGKDVFRISMKNEFLYPILIATSKAKHYLAIATMQEGNLLPTPRKDIKGVGFRSSTFPRIIRDDFEGYVVKLVEEIEKGEPIRAASILEHISKLEMTVFHSVQKNESTYLQTVSVKREEEYADPDQSQYFYYELWKAVFEKDYGEMVIPNKCFKIPLIREGKILKDPVFLAELQQKYPKIYTHLTAFIEANPKRNISYLLIPPFRGDIDPFFVSIMDIRRHTYQVMEAYYNLLDGLGIGTVDARADGLVSDFYDPAIPFIPV